MPKTTLSYHLQQAAQLLTLALSELNQASKQESEAALAEGGRDELSAHLLARRTIMRAEASVRSAIDDILV